MRCTTIGAERRVMGDSTLSFILSFWGSSGKRAVIEKMPIDRRKRGQTQWSAFEIMGLSKSSVHKYCSFEFRLYVTSMSAFVNIAFDKFRLKQLLPLVADALPSATEND